MINLPQFLRSTRHALRGVATVFRTENNFRIQVVVTVLVFVFASLVHVRSWEYILLILLCMSVLVLELLNSVIERMTDGFQPRLRPIARDIKDLMAGAVLLAALTAVAVGLLIFYPYLAALLSA